MKYANVILYSLLVLSQISSFAFGDAIQKHPRVAEVEDALAKDASTYLKARLPQSPFIVTVSVDPLRRYDSDGFSKNGKQAEKLPYLDLADEEIKDEWDDPQLSVQHLLARVKKVSITISMPNQIMDDEVAEVKEALFQSLHLIQARDEIVVNRKSWKVTNNSWLYVLSAFSIAFFFLLGFFLINRMSVNKITNALADSKTASSANSSGSYSAPLMAPAAPQTQHDQSKTSGNGDLQLSDPIRTREILLRLIETISTRSGFPSLNDMIALDTYGQKNSMRLGAILREFPLETRRKLFSLSPGNRWLDAFNKAGSLSLDCLDLLQNMAKGAPSQGSAGEEQMLVLVWRLDEKLPDFMRLLSQQTAFAILSKLPKSIAINAARKSFPGAWAALLNTEFTPVVLDPNTIQQVSQKAMEQHSLNDLNRLERYRQEMELCEYLKSSDPLEEREIYLASPRDSVIHNLRPPFFKIFDQDEEVLKSFVPQFSPEQWALALFNVPKGERQKIEQVFTDKQKLLYKEKLRRFDHHAPEKGQTGDGRELIARTLHDYLVQKEENVISLSLDGESTGNAAKAA